MAALQNSNILYEDEDYDHLDFNRQDQLESFCRSRLNRVTGRTLYILLMEMRKADLSRDRVLDPAVIDQMVGRFGIPLSPCMKQLHAKFRDKRFVRSTNYENLMRFLETRREERQRLGPDEIQDLSLSSHPSHYQPQHSRGKRASQNRLSLAMMVEDASLVRNLQDSLARQIIDIDLLANDMMEVAVGPDQVRVEEAVRVLQEHNVNLNRGLLGRMINYSKTFSNSSCSIQKMMKILRTALEPCLEPEDPEPRVRESQTTVGLQQPAQGRRERKQRRDLDMKVKYTARLKQALYQSIKQHAGGIKNIF